MSYTDQDLAEFCQRMQDLEPGDVLGSLDDSPPGTQMVVLAKKADGKLLLSTPAQRLNIVEHPFGPFQWSEEYGTLLMADGEPFESISIKTTVAKHAALDLPRTYLDTLSFLGSLHLPSLEQITELLNVDTKMALQLEAIINSPWTESLEERCIAACSLVLGRSFSFESSTRLLFAINMALRMARGVVKLRLVGDPGIGSSGFSGSFH